jgi:four helix bundle protein
MKDNVVKEKSYQFALKIVEVSRNLLINHKEYVLSKQLMRSGTSIGANIEEAIGGVSDKDILNKISTAYKEARETSYWIRLLRDSKLIESLQSEILLNDCDELIRIIGSIQKSMKEKLTIRNS